MDTTALLPAFRKQHGMADDAPCGLKWRTADIKSDENAPANPDAFTARINVDALDRDNEVVLPDGVDLREFDKSGAGFFNHDYSRGPIFVPGPVKMVNGTLVGKGTFLKNQLAQDVKEFVHAMAASGKSAGVSIGFMPTNNREPSKKDIERYGPAVTRVYTGWKLLEWSIAPVQSNPQAVVTEIGKGVKASVVKSLYGIEPMPEPVPARKMYVVQSPAPMIVVRQPNRAKIVAVATAKALARISGRLYV